jgi:hypothetical protein
MFPETRIITGFGKSPPVPKATLPVPRRVRVPPGDADTHPLLAPFAEAQDTVARLEATAAIASPAVVQGLVARVAYREAAGWLAHGRLDLTRIRPAASRWCERGAWRHCPRK